MDMVPITPNLTMLWVNGWQLYTWHDDDSVTLIDAGAPGSGAEVLSAVPGVDRIVLTHGHVDHCGSAAELHQATGAPVDAGAGEANVFAEHGFLIANFEAEVRGIEQGLAPVVELVAEMEEHAFLGLGDEEAELELAVGRLYAANILRTCGDCEKWKDEKRKFWPPMNTDERRQASGLHLRLSAFIGGRFA